MNDSKELNPQLKTNVTTHAIKSVKKKNSYSDIFSNVS